MITDRLQVFCFQYSFAFVSFNGSFSVPGPASSAEIQFLATGILPNATNQTFISIYTPGSQRDPIADPYSVPVGAEAGDMSGTAPA